MDPLSVLFRDHNLLSNRLTTTQDTHDQESKYSFCTTNEVVISVVHGMEKNKQQRNAR